MPSSSNRNTDTPKRSREDSGSRSNSGAKKGKVSLDIREVKPEKKNKDQTVAIPRESHAVDNADDAWMHWYKFAPVGLYDETDHLVRVSKDVQLQMEVNCELPSGEILSKVITAGTIGSTFWFQGVQFSAPGNYTITYTIPKFHADAHGYHVEPFIIPVHILPALETEMETVTPSKRDHKKKKKPAPAPPTPSSATNTRRASASSSSNDSSSNSRSDRARRSSTGTSTSTTTVAASHGGSGQRTSLRQSDAKVDAAAAATASASPAASPRASRRLSSGSSSTLEGAAEKAVIPTTPQSAARRKRRRSSLPVTVEDTDTDRALEKEEEKMEEEGVDTSSRGRASSRRSLTPHSASKKKKRGSLSVTVAENTDDVEEVIEDVAPVAVAVEVATNKSDMGVTEGEEEERAHLQRNMVLSSLSAVENIEEGRGDGEQQQQQQQRSGAVAGLAALLPPALVTALVDDAHDIHVRVTRRDEFKKQARSKKSRKSASTSSSSSNSNNNSTSNNKDSDRVDGRELSVEEVFLSAAPSSSESQGQSYSVHSIVHDPQFTEFMLRKTPSNRRKKHASQLSYNVNTFLVAFESLCHCSPDSSSTSEAISSSSSSLSSPLVCGPVLYDEERRSLESSGLLGRIVSSRTEFLYHHCNARHLLRALVLILLTSPKYADEGLQSDDNTKEPVTAKAAAVDEENTASFFEFADRLLEYLNEHAFPLLYQH